MIVEKENYWKEYGYDLPGVAFYEIWNQEDQMVVRFSMQKTLDKNGEKCEQNEITQGNSLFQISLADYKNCRCHFWMDGKEHTLINPELDIFFDCKNEALNFVERLAREGKAWHDYLRGIKDAETLQSITYRAFELAESAIKAAIAQAIEEQLGS